MVVKPDRKDARGIAQLLRRGWLRPVHCTSPRAQEVRALLVGRKLLQGKLLQGKLLDVELSIRGIYTTCRRLMPVPGVGALVAITFTSAIDGLPLRPGGRRRVID